LLSDLNQAIAEQQGVSVQDLAIKPNPQDNVRIQELAKIQELASEELIDDPGKTSSNSVNYTAIENLPPDQQAKEYRSRADKLAKEAANFRRLAEELVPTKKKTAIKE
jgi:hypothetical protein